MPITILTDCGPCLLPPEGCTLAEFREWAGSANVPDHTPVWFVKGTIWIDFAREQVFTHASVRGEIVAGIDRVVGQAKSGVVLARGVFWVHPGADVAGNPDGLFISYRSMETGRLRLLPEPPGNCDELEGTLDMVLEVVSDSSEKKDNQALREAYWEAGIPEYWLVDARGEEVEFDVLKRGPRGYTATKKQGGWVKSAAFGRSFRLTRTLTALGQPEFTLEVR